jgi:addiction module RelE/StbE family toxin
MRSAAPRRRVEWRDAARRDLLSIIDYISDDNPTAAQRLKDEIEGKVSKLPRHPKLYRPGRVDGTREMIVRPNYVVVYVGDRAGTIVLRVLHAAQVWPPEDETR